MNMLRRLLFSFLAALPASTSAQSVISNTIVVPLHYRTIDGGAFKLGIYASIGGSTTPQIFEFDTGGAGLYAAYATNTNSPWWGGSFASTGLGVTNTYDSGIRYEGDIVTTAVALYSDSNSTTPLVMTANNLRVGQMTSIAYTNGPTLWTPEGMVGVKPPIDSAFYGDFGMSLAYANSGIINLIAQLRFTNDIIPGFRVRGFSNSNNTPYLQIGLTAADTSSSSAFYFGMNTNTNAPVGAVFTNSRSAFYSEQVFNANMTISNATTNFTTNLGITTDTGASTTIHNADLGGIPGELYTTNASGKGHLVAGSDFYLSGMTLGGTNADFFQFVTAEGQVSIQDNKTNNTTFYLNSGIALFQKYDVIYNLGDGQIGFEPIPEPSTWALLSVAAIGSALFYLRRKKCKPAAMADKASNA